MSGEAGMRCEICGAELTWDADIFGQIYAYCPDSGHTVETTRPLNQSRLEPEGSPEGSG